MNRDSPRKIVYGSPPKRFNWYSNSSPVKNSPPRDNFKPRGTPPYKRNKNSPKWKNDETLSLVALMNKGFADVADQVGNVKIDMIRRMKNMQTDVKDGQKNLRSHIDQIDEWNRDQITSIKSELKEIHTGMDKMENRVDNLETGQIKISSPGRSKTGFSPSRGSRDGGSPRGSSGNCFKCNQFGHFARNCPMNSPGRADADDFWRRSVRTPERKLKFGGVQKAETPNQ